MKRTYLSLFALLLVAFAFFAGLSAFSDELDNAFGLKTSHFMADLLGDSEIPFADTLPESPTEPLNEANVTVHVPLDTTKKNILFIGDSMLERLSPRIAAYAEGNGHQMNTVIWYGSSTEVWAKSGRVRQCVQKYHPDYILICLGGNELFVSDIINRRAKYVRQIIAELDNIPFIWIGPPNWKKDTGINKMIQSIVPKGHFYLSYTPDQHYDRAADGAHPTIPSAAKWADRICKWIMESSASPILLNVPNKYRVFCHTETYSMTDDGAAGKPMPPSKPAAAPTAQPAPIEQPPAAQPAPDDDNANTIPEL